ncbi:actin-like ATPase domain-containing protein [Amniculicola lignicola CBS 123094]|uniref:Actin-like ATPase domain-containing protein n=1 Tax=Amniculicola lignicola CBS 123094 TaxID=1392246 RepID=A0A6A5VX31_9PLEO|nr:actin-like ATPase domain-containing protein [Amniculicola lignicola CBS 123094]
MTNRLVIAVDYGTTFTGVAWQVVPYNQIDADLKDVKLQKLWPGDKPGDKVPSVISYSPTAEHNYNWGFDVTGQSLRWTKLQLDQASRKQELQWILDALIGMKDLDMDEVRMEHGLPSYPAKDPVDIVTDYLIKLRAHIKEKIIEEMTDRRTFEEMPKEIVITVPAAWSDSAKNLTFRAFTQAGFTERYFRNLKGMLLITEPAAAALYSIKKLTPKDEYEAEDFIGPGDCFVQADMGGGTVDCVSYEVQKSKPSLVLKEVGVATGAQCGATFIDREFIKWLKRKLGEANFDQLDVENPEDAVGSHTVFGPSMKFLMDQFVNRKERYTGKVVPGQNIIDLPAPLVDLHDPERGVDNGQISLSDKDFREIYHFSLDKTTRLVASQIQQVEHVRKRVRYVFLSGGFAESKYVQRALKDFGRHRNITVLVPEKPVTAVVIGAVAVRLEEEVEHGVYMTPCKKNYGICISEPYSTYRHSEMDGYKDPFDGQWKAKNQIVWMIKKGDLLQSNQPTQASTHFQRKFSLNDTREFTTDFVTYKGNDPPPETLDKMPICKSSQPPRILLHSPPIAKYQITPLRYNLKAVPSRSITSVRIKDCPWSLCAYFKVNFLLHSSQKGLVSISCGPTELASAHV